MEFHERLRALRIRSSMTQKELGQKTGVSVMTVRNWESGAKQPSMQAIISLSRCLRTSADTLLGLPGYGVPPSAPVTRTESALLQKYRTLDAHGRRMVDTVCALERERIFSDSRTTVSRIVPGYSLPSAAGFSAPFDADGCEPFELPDEAPAETDFVVRIQGDSMEPYIQDGSTVFVKKSETLRTGDVGIFSVNGAMYCKLYRPEHDGGLTLVSANPARQDCNVVVHAGSADTVVCLGRVLLDEPVPMM